MSDLHVGMTGFDITPRFHPTCGAWGTTPKMIELHMPLLGRCLVLAENDQRLVWFSADLVGNSPRCTDRLRDEVAQALGTSPTPASRSFPPAASATRGMCIDTVRDLCICARSDIPDEFPLFIFKTLRNIYISVLCSNRPYG